MSRKNLAISIIIPVRDRLTELKRVVKGLMLQDCAPDRFEVILVDDSSGDETQIYLGGLVRMPFALHVLHTPGAGAAAARNRGLAAVNSRLVLFLDADTIPGPSLVRYHIRLHQGTDENVCHMGKIVMSEELKSTAQARWNELDVNDLDGNDVEISFRRYRTANTSFPVALLRQVGGFNESLQVAEDLELAYRLAEQGTRFYYHADVVATHHHPLTLQDYFNKGALYGQAVALWQRQRPDLSGDLAGRFGLYHAGLSSKERLRYRTKVLLVNRWTVPVWMFAGRKCRGFLFGFSNRVYKMMYGYHLRASHQRAMAHSSV